MLLYIVLASYDEEEKDPNRYAAVDVESVWTSLDAAREQVKRLRKEGPGTDFWITWSRLRE